MISIPDRFTHLVSRITAEVGSLVPGPAVQARLQSCFPVESPTFRDLESMCKSGVNEGWLCTKEAAGIKYGRVLKPSPKTDQFSVDVVEMDNIVGPFHVHPNGEIDMIMPISGDARFDGSPHGWKVYAPGSAHSPAVSGGKALVLYLLPEGAIEFKSAAV